MPHTQPEVHNPTTVFHEDVGVGRNTIYGDRLFNERYDIMTLPIGAWLVLPTTLSHRVTRNNWGGFLQDQSYIRICNTKEIAIGEQQDLKDCFGIDSNIMPITVNVEVGELAGINTTQLGDVYDQSDYHNGDVLRWDEGLPTTMTLNFAVNLDAGDVIYQERMNAQATLAASVDGSNSVSLVNVRGNFKVEDIREANLSLLSGGVVTQLTTGTGQPIRPTNVVRAGAHSGEGQMDYASFYPSKPVNYGPSEPTGVKYSGDIWFNTTEGDLLMWNGDAWVEVVPRIQKDSGGGGNIDTSLFSQVAFTGDYNDLINIPSGGGGQTGGTSGSTGSGVTIYSMGGLSNSASDALLDPVPVPVGHTIVVFTTSGKDTDGSPDTEVAIYEAGGFSVEYAKGQHSAQWRNTTAASKNVRLFATEGAADRGAEAIYQVFSNDVMDINSIVQQLSTVASTGQYSDLIGTPSDISDFTDNFGIISAAARTFVQNTAPTVRASGPPVVPLNTGDFWFDTATSGSLHIYDGNNWVQL